LISDNLIYALAIIHFAPMTTKRRSTAETIEKKKKKKKTRVPVDNTATTNSVGHIPKGTTAITLHQHLISFLRTRQQHSDNIYLNIVNEYFNKDQNVSEEKDTSVQENVEYLTRFLNQTDCITQGINRVHVATLLFPWAIQTLLYQYREHKETFPTNLLWSTFAQSYTSLLSDGNSSEEILQNLPQGTLNKLVPYALEIAFTVEKDNINDKIVTSCLLWMIHLNTYRPTMDHICTVIIPLLHKLLVQESHSDDTHLMVHTNQYNIVRSIMELIQSRLESRCSNPKKTFQIMASEVSLVSFASIHSLRPKDDLYAESMDVILRKIMCLAFFDGQYHMDGFRSMNLSIPVLNETIQLVNDGPLKSDAHKKRKGTVTGHEQSYQKLLLQTFGTVLSSQDESKVDAKKWIGFFLPIVLDEFMKECLRMDETPSRKSRVDLTAKMQLRFWSHMMQPFFHNLEDFGEKHYILQRSFILYPIQQSLEILLQYNCYLPSYSDPDNEHLKYLQAIGEIILRFSENNSNNLYMETTLKQFDVLLALDHNIFHNNLTRLMVCAMGMTTCANQQVYLFTCACKVYEKLRRINYFLDCVIESRFKLTDSAVDFVHEDQFINALSSAIHSLPHGQLTTVLNMMDAHILKAASKEQYYLDFVIDLYVLVLKGIHITETNAANVQEICSSTESNIIPKLLKIDSHGILDIECNLTNSGLYLLGWIITVSTKCMFWLNDTSAVESNSISHFDIFPTIKYVSKTSNTNKIASLGALQHLACYKLIQLHSWVYIREQEEGFAKIQYVKQDGTSSKQLINDACELAGFIIAAAKNRRSISHRDTNWKIVCEHLGVISKYATTEQMESFLSWFMITYASDESDEVTNDEKEAVSSLLLDTSFFETFCLCDTATNVAFSVIQNRLQRSDIKKDIISWDDCCSQTKMIFQRKPYGLDESHLLFVTRILRLLKALLPDSTSSTAIYMRLYGSILVFVDSVWLLNDYSERSDVLDILDATISILISDVKIIPHKLMDCAPIAENIISCILLMMKKIHGRISSLSKKNWSLMVSGSVLAANVLRLSWDQDNEINGIQTCSSLIEDAQKSNVDISASLIISRQCVLMALRNLQDTNSDKSLIVGSSHLFQTLKSLLENCTHIQDLSIIGQLILPFFTDMILLGRQLCELIFEDDDEVWFQDQLSVYVKKSMSIMKGTCGSFDDAVESGCFYFLASIISHGLISFSEATNVTFDIQDAIISQLKKRDGFIHPLLDSTYAFICRQASSDTLSELGKNLLDKLRVSELHFEKLSAVVYCFHIMLLSTSSTGMKIVADFAQTLIVPALHLVESNSTKENTDTWSLRVQRIFGFLRSVISNSGVFVVKGHDYAAIFTTINTVFGDTVRYDETLFVSACDLVTTMLKVDRKLMYGCVPSLTTTLRHILYHVFQLPSPVSGDDTANYQDSIHAISSLFQLLPDHKDVIKKHMMHLVVFFADHSQISMDMWKKSQLEPVLFNLLDSLSDFEIKQMGTLMQPSAKATFQSFFKKYNRNKYKGAY
jgi:hypothetical protein